MYLKIFVLLYVTWSMLFITSVYLKPFSVLIKRTSAWKPIIHFILPPYFTDGPLLAIKIRQCGVCHIVAIIHQGNPFQNLKFMSRNKFFNHCTISYLRKVPTGKWSVCWHVWIRVGRIVLEYWVGIISIVVSLTEVCNI